MHAELRVDDVNWPSLVLGRLGDDRQAGLHDPDVDLSDVLDNPFTQIVKDGLFDSADAYFPAGGRRIRSMNSFSKRGRSMSVCTLHVFSANQGLLNDSHHNVLPYAPLRPLTATVL